MPCWRSRSPARRQAQQPPRPPIQTTKVDGTDGVYIFRNGNHQAMFIVTNEGVIATDPVAYGRPTGGQAYVDEIRKVTDKPIRYLIYSHHHFDHIAGGKAFKDAGATVIAHRRAKERLATLKDPHTVLPDEAVGDKGRTITLGGTTLELTYHGLNHSDSTLVMRLPKEKIVFIVDTIPVGPVPGRGMIDFYPLESEAFMKQVLAMDWERMIPGHPGPGDRLGTKKDVQDQLAAAGGGVGRDEEARRRTASAGTRRRRSSSCRATRTGRAMRTTCRSSRGAIAGCGGAGPEQSPAGSENAPRGAFRFRGRVPPCAARCG